MNMPPYFHPGSRTGLSLLAAICGCYALAIFQKFSSAAISLDLMRDLSLSPTLLGLLGSASIYSYAVSQPVTGVFLDLWGPRRVMTMAMLGTAVGSLGYALAFGFYSALIARLLTGFFVGMVFGAGIIALNQNFAPRRLPRLSSLFMAASGVGLFLASSTLSVITDQFGWRYAFAAMALLSLGWGLFCFWRIPERAPTEAETEARSQRPKTWPALMLIFTSPQFLILGLYFCGSDALYASFTGLWAGPFVSQVYGLDTLATGRILAGASLCFTFGAFLLAMVYERFFSTHRGFLMALGLFNVLLSLPLVLFPGGLSHGALFLLVMAAPLGAQASGLLCVMARDLFPPTVTGRVIGCLNLFPIALGAVLQTLIGRMLDGAGAEGLNYAAAYGRAFTLILITTLASVGLAFFYRGRSRETAAIK